MYNTAKYTRSLVGCARWEEAYIMEWLDYHKSIGFDHVYLWSNDDDPDLLRHTVAPHLEGADPFVSFGHWPVRGQQGAIYEHFLTNHAHETEWFCFLDIDEFLVLRGCDNIAAFMAPLEPHTDCVYFNWAPYGANGHLTRPPGGVLTNHTRRKRSIDFHTKNLIRSAKVSVEAVREGNQRGAKAYFHFWDDYNLPELRICDVLGEPITAYTENFPIRAHALTHRPGYQARVLDTAYCAHFQIKSEEDFMRRVARGGNSSQKHWETMYREGRHTQFLAQLDEVEDRYLADYWAPKQVMLDAVRRSRQPPARAAQAVWPDGGSQSAPQAASDHAMTYADTAQ